MDPHLSCVGWALRAGHIHIHQLLHISVLDRKNLWNGKQARNAVSRFAGRIYFPSIDSTRPIAQQKIFSSFAMKSINYKLESGEDEKNLNW